MKTKSPTLRKGESPLGAFIKTSLATFTGATGFTAALLCLAALIISRVDVSHTLLQPVTTVVSALSVFLSALLSAKRRTAFRLGTGPAAGILLCAVLFLLAAIMGKHGVGAQLFVKLTALCCAGGLGGILGSRCKHQSTKLKM